MRSLADYGPHRAEYGGYSVVPLTALGVTSADIDPGSLWSLR
jgi:hypothetical protein